MKRISKKFLALFLAVIMTLSVFAVLASAKTYPVIDGIELRERRTVAVGDTFPYSRQEDAKDFHLQVMGSGSDILEITYSLGKRASKAIIVAKEEGVALLLVRSFDDEDVIDEYFILVVVYSSDVPLKTMGKVTGIRDTSASYTYKQIDKTVIKADIDYTEGKNGIWYTQYCTVENTAGDVGVDNSGNVYISGVGTTSGKYYVVDSKGNVFSASYSVSASYTWWQKLIIFLFFGWIWY